MAPNRREFAYCLAATTLSPCYSSASGAPISLRAGAAIASITPHLGVLLDGPISKVGPARHVHDELHARCLALESGGSRVAIVVCDCTMISREVCDEAKRLVLQDAGVPAERVLISATHNHSSPRAIGIGRGELDRQYLAFLARRIADAVRVALNNLAPAEIGWGVGQRPDFVFNRRWIMKPGTVPPNPFGGKTDRVQMNPVGVPENLVEPAGPVDPEVSVLSVRHANGRPLALLANYGLHYVGGVGPGNISADYFGAFATRIERELGTKDQYPPFVAIMSNGTSGDVTAIDFRFPLPSNPPYSRIRELGDGVAEEALRVYKRIEHRGGIELKMRESELELPVRRPAPDRLVWARELWSKASGKEKLTRPEIYAQEAVFLSEFPATVRLKLQALRVGTLGIASAPCEVFAETGLAIKRGSKLRPTFIIELANGFNGYLPTPRQHSLGGYETWPARSSYLAVEAEPKIRAELLRLLEEMSVPA